MVIDGWGTVPGVELVILEARPWKVQQMPQCQFSDSVLLIQCLFVVNAVTQ